MTSEFDHSSGQDRTWLWQGMAVVIWLLVTGASFAGVAAYESVPGPVSATPCDWPSDVSISRAADQRTMLMFLHPRCPCSRASLAELHKLAESESSGRLRIVVFRPQNSDAKWTESDVLAQAKQIPFSELVWDDGGRLAARFGAQTSGHVLIYNEHGKLTFSGGVTAVRGHAGWNSHAAAANAQWRGENSSVHEAPVFGCPLIETNPLQRNSSCEPQR